MISVWLIIITIIVSVLLLGINLYLFVLYSHKDDNKDIIGWIGRIVVIAGNFVNFALVLLIPLDVANSRGDGGGFNMDKLFMAVLIIHFLFLVFFIPVTLFLYESDDEQTFLTRLCQALFYEIFLAIIVIVLAFIAYGGMRSSDLSDCFSRSYEGFVTSEEPLTAITN